MTTTRVLVTSRATITHVFTVDRVPTDAAGDVTVDVKKLDGTAVASGTAVHDDTGTYSHALSASAALDAWTADWSGSIGGATVTVRDYVEHVGGFLFSLDQAVDELKLSPSISVATLAARRIEVERECEERCCFQAFVPRYAREKVSGTGTERLRVRWPLVRTVRSVTVAGTAWTVAQLATISPTPDGVLHLPTGGEWPLGSGNIIVEYEHGHDEAPPDISTAAITRLGSRLAARSSAIPARASSFTAADGGMYRLTLPDRYTTGIPEVDAVYAAYPGTRRRVVIA